MAPATRVLLVSAAAAACLVLAAHGLTAFLLPAGSARAAAPAAAPAAASRPGQGGAEQPGSWGLAAACVALGAHAGLAVATRARSAVNAAAKETAVTTYKETAADERLFEKVFMDYTSEYLKGPMYWHEDKLQGFLPDYPGTP
eukprot:CAMPEP_0171183412 /NCGR_PEP_ID=MMETSP0790-20130122/15265_1 /TAXON_ID=2925 /ORGANISM="Alexandrium catenella, Strain OF101" /LENGTH=142 /DNA_ID=CAMNT_0011648387 /DNA_START=59 /DNA_END=483 /DNA_ORIENTATION=+